MKAIKSLWVELKQILGLFDKDTSLKTKPELSQDHPPIDRSEKLEQAQLCLDAANLIIQKGEVTASLKEYDRAIALNPNFSGAYFYRGNAFSVQGRYEEAIKDYQKAIELQLNIPELYSHLGKSLEQSGYREEAIKMYIKSLAIQPEQKDLYATLYFNLKKELEKSEAAYPNMLSLYAEY